MASFSRFRSFSSALTRPQASITIPSRQPSLCYSTSHNHPPSSHLHDHGRGYSHAHSYAHPKPRGHIKRSHALTAALSASCLAFTVGVLYPPDIVTLISPRPAPGPLDPSLPEARAYVEELERRLQQLPVLEKHRNSSDADEWYETRPYVNYPEEHRVNNLTAGTLRGPGKIAVSPVLRVRKDESETFAVTHFGRGLCGHDGIVHGGLLATILDESLGRVAITNFPEKIGVTATLTVEYKAPTKADQFVVLRCRLVELKGRKAYVEGSIEDLNGTTLATAKALFIQPKYAKLLNTKTISKAIGEPPVAAAKLTGGDVPPVPGLENLR
ncbi:hypothetical protein ACEPAI_8580 [Sanghuangporus weigelae]